MKKIIILGGGGHAASVIAAVETMDGFSVFGLLDPELPVSHRVLGYPILGTDKILEDKQYRDCFAALGVGSVRADLKRKQIYDRTVSLGFRFPPILHRSAVIAKSAVVGDGAQILAGAVIQPLAQIHNNAIVNTGCIIEHGAQIHAHSHIAPGAVLGGEVIIGEGSMIGLGARILPGVRIGSRVTVGAGAVVLKDVEDGQIVFGVPAKPAARVPQ